MEEKRTLEWYFEHLPETIEYRWVNRYGGPYSEGPYDFDAPVHWSEKKYTYELRISKANGYWYVDYVLPDYDGDTVNIMPRDYYAASDMIMANDTFLANEEKYKIRSKNIYEVLEKVYNWLESQGIC